MGPSRPGQLVDRGTTDPNPSHPGELVDSAGHGAGARVTQESWSTLRAIGFERDSPRRAGRNRRPSDTSASPPGQLVDPSGPRTRARVTR